MLRAKVGLRSADCVAYAVRPFTSLVSDVVAIPMFSCQLHDMKCALYHVHSKGRKYSLFILQFVSYARCLTVVITDNIYLYIYTRTLGVIINTWVSKVRLSI